MEVSLSKQPLQGGERTPTRVAFHDISFHLCEAPSLKFSQSYQTSIDRNKPREKMKRLRRYFINSFISEWGTSDPSKMDALQWASPRSALCRSCGLHTPNTPKPHSPGHPLRNATTVGFVIYNVRPTNKFYYSNMRSKPKERSTLIFCSEATFAAPFTYFSLFHHRGTVSRNYYVKQYIKNESWYFLQ